MSRSVRLSARAALVHAAWDRLPKLLGITLADATIVQKQAFVVVIDSVIAAGRNSTGDLFHRIFAALVRE